MIHHEIYLFNNQTANTVFIVFISYYIFYLCLITTSKVTFFFQIYKYIFTYEAFKYVFLVIALRNVIIFDLIEIRHYSVDYCVQKEHIMFKLDLVPDDFYLVRH